MCLLCEVSVVSEHSISVHVVYVYVSERKYLDVYVVFVRKT